MKIAFLADTHFGARNDAPLFLDHFLDFFENQFFPYLEENKIDIIKTNKLILKMSLKIILNKLQL